MRALLAAALAAYSISAWADVGINLYFASYHFDRDKAKELGLTHEFNPGLGVRYRQAQSETLDFFADAGFYSDSKGNTAKLLGGGGLWHATERLRLGGGFVLLKSETYNHGDAFIARQFEHGVFPQVARCERHQPGRFLAHGLAQLISWLMLRAIGLAVAMLLCTAALAQNFAGTFTTTNQEGGTVTLKLTQDAASNVKGTLTGNNNTFQVDAKATAQGLMGKITGAQGSLYLMAQYEGANLVVILAEPMPNGQPNLDSARHLLFSKAGAAPAGKKPPPEKASGLDGQLSALLTRNAWCGFTYNKNSGTSTSERVVFMANGLVTQSSGAQTYNSGPAGSVAGQSSNANQARWKVADGMLHLSQDGVNWAPQQLQVTQNSNGSPIIKSGGKEYMQCR